MLAPALSGAPVRPVPARLVYPQAREKRPPRVELRAMTLCVAAQCRWLPQYKKCFVLCADGRLDAGPWGSNDVAIKFHTLGYNFMAMMAGDWETARGLCGETEKALKTKPFPETASDLFGNLAQAAEAFCDSVLCSPEKECAILVTGFLTPGDPMMAVVRVNDRVPTVERKFDRELIGEGMYPASLMLDVRGYDPLNTDIERACYIVYEAKRFSESVLSVGPGTRMKIHIPTVEKPTTEEHRFVDILPQGIAKFEEDRKRFFVQAIEALSPLELTDLRFTK